MLRAWNRFSVPIRVCAVITLALVLAGVAILMATLLSTEHGSGSFDAGMAASRWVLQGGAFLGLLTLLCILIRKPKKHP